MEEKIDIKMIEDMYILKKGKDHNLFVVIRTKDDRKLSSSIYVTYEDLEALSNTFLPFTPGTFTGVKSCNLSTGALSITKEIVPLEEGPVEIYNVSINDGNFKSKTTIKVVDEFLESLRQCHHAIRLPFSKNEFAIPTKKSKKNKKKKGLFE